MNNNAVVSYFIRQYLVWLSNAFIVIDNVFYTVASLLSWNVQGLYNTIVSRIVYIGIDDDIRVAADSIRGDKNKLVLLLLLIAIVTIIYLNTYAHTCSRVTVYYFFLPLVLSHPYRIFIILYTILIIFIWRERRAPARFHRPPELISRARNHRNFNNNRKL